MTTPPRSGPPSRWRDPSRRRARRLTLLGLGAVLLAALPALPLLLVRAAETGSYTLAEEVLAPTRQQVDNLEPPPTLDHPINILMIGSDSRAGLDDEQLERAATEANAGQRADSIMIAHVSPARDDIVLLSVPRDLYVEDADGSRGGRINAALNDGPTAMVDAMERLTEMDINHYVEIDFGGFMEIVDELGGVELCNDTGERLRDTDAGLDMPPGCHQMVGSDALAFVRARKIDSDFGRMGRQQQFLRAIFDRVTDGDVLLNPTALATTARAVSRHLSTDAGLTGRTVVDLVQRLSTVSEGGIDTRTYPSEGAQRCATCAAYVYAKPEASLLTRALARDETILPPVGRGLGTDVTIDDVRVELVLDAGNADATLERLSDDLERLDFDVADVEVAESLSSGAVLAYPAPLGRQARLIADFLGEEVRLERADADARSDTLVLTVGEGTIVGMKTGITPGIPPGTTLNPGGGAHAVR